MASLLNSSKHVKKIIPISHESFHKIEEEEGLTMSFYMKQRYPIKNQSNKQKTTDITRKLQINIPHEHDTKQFSLN